MSHHPCLSLRRAGCLRVQIKKRIALAPNHSCPYVSLGRRIKSIEKLLVDDPEQLRDLAAFADLVNTPAKALKALDFHRHPATSRIRTGRDPLHAKIIYHADPWTLYSSTPPVIPPRNDGQIPPAPPPPPHLPPGAPDGDGQIPPPPPPPHLPPGAPDGGGNAGSRGQALLPDSCGVAGAASSSSMHVVTGAPSSSSCAAARSSPPAATTDASAHLSGTSDAAWSALKKHYILQDIPMFCRAGGSGSDGAGSASRMYSLQISSSCVATLQQLLRHQGHQTPMKTTSAQATSSSLEVDLGASITCKAAKWKMVSRWTVTFWFYLKSQQHRNTRCCDDVGRVKRRSCV